MVTERPTETMNSTVPAESPPRRIPARSETKPTGLPASPYRAAKGRLAKSQRKRIAENQARCPSVSSPPCRSRDKNSNPLHNGEGWIGTGRRLDVAAIAPRGLAFAAADAEFLARVLYVLDGRKDFLVQFLVRAHHHFVQILVHDDVVGLRVDLDRSLRAVEFPALQRFHRRLAVHLALGGVNGVNDGRD